MQLFAEIPIGGMKMRDAVEMLGKLNHAGYETNIKSKSGNVVIQLQKHNN